MKNQNSTTITVDPINCVIYPVQLPSITCRVVSAFQRGREVRFIRSESGCIALPYPDTVELRIKA